MINSKASSTCERSNVLYLWQQLWVVSLGGCPGLALHQEGEGVEEGPLLRQIQAWVEVVVEAADQA